MNRRFSLLLALTLVASALVFIAPAPGIAPAASAVEGATRIAGDQFDVVLSDDGWASYEYRISLRDAAQADAWVTGRSADYRQVLHVGRAIFMDGTAGCRFEGSMDASHESAAVGMIYVDREVKFSLDRCEMVVEGAWLSEVAARNAGLVGDLARESAASAAQEPGTLGSPSTGHSELFASSYSSYEYSGFIRGHTTDPPGLYLAKTYSYEQWSWSGSCATSWNRWPDWDQVWWWSLESSWSSYYGSCQRGIQTYGKYNTNVCGGGDTWAQHTVNFKSTGDPNSWASWSLSKWGACSWLLSSGRWYDPY